MPGQVAELPAMPGPGPTAKLPAPPTPGRMVRVPTNPASRQFAELPSTTMQGQVAELPATGGGDEEAQQARLILQKMLLNEDELPTEERSVEQIARLYHKLGSLNLQLGSLQQAIRYLSKALQGRKVVRPLPVEDIVESTNLLAKALELNQEYDKARACREWLQREIKSKNVTARPNSRSSSSRLRKDSTAELPQAYSWTTGQGFNVDTTGAFRFEEWDMKMKMSPLHLAVQEENANMVRIMADHSVSLDRGPDVGWPTPLLLAASTRNRDTVSILLDRGARVDIRDRSGRTALHRCQARSGGVQVAELILNKWPELVNDVDSAGKTALYMAVDMANEKMVHFLLDRNADPNKCYLPQGSWATTVLCTPLIAAIDNVATKSSQNIRMVESLLAHGADPELRAGDGRDAFSAAANAGLANKELKTLLNKYETISRKTSLASVDTANSRSSSNTTSTGLSRARFWDRR